MVTPCSKSFEIVWVSSIGKRKRSDCVVCVRNFCWKPLVRVIKISVIVILIPIRMYRAVLWHRDPTLLRIWWMSPVPRGLSFSSPSFDRFRFIRGEIPGTRFLPIVRLLSIISSSFAYEGIDGVIRLLEARKVSDKPRDHKVVYLLPFSPLC